MPSDFPRYLTTNFRNRDAQDIELVPIGNRPYVPTYLDIYNTSGAFQANFRQEGELTISGPPPADGRTLKWKDRFAAHGITINRFGYNASSFTVEREKPGLLVYMDRFHPRWRAYIDGKPVRIYRTNGRAWCIKREINS